MAEQAIFRAGNSNVVAIPKNLSKEWQVKSGQKVIVEERGDELVIKKITKKLGNQNPTPDKEFKKWLNQALKEDGEILDELAKR